MGPVMRAAARVRGLPGVVAALALAIPSSGWTLAVAASSVSPGTVVPLGTVVTITATIVNDNGAFGTLCANPQLSTAGCSTGVCSVPDGLFAISADDPLIAAAAAALTPDLPFSYAFGESAVVVWQFTATRTGTTAFSIVAHDNTGVSEGCGDPSADASCPPNFGFISDPLTCGFATVTVTATLTGRVNVSVVAPTPRPANTAYPGDTIAVVMSLTNTGGTPLTLNAGVSATRAGSTALVVPAAAPAFPAGLPAGTYTPLTWTWSVAGHSPTPSTVTFSTDVERTYAVAGPLTVSAPPLTVTATLLIDPDGAAPAWATAFAGSAYYMANDEIWVVGTVANLGGSSIDVDPDVVLPDTAGGNGVPDVVPTAPRSPAGVQVLGSLTSRTFTWKYQVNRADAYQACYTPPFNNPPVMEFKVRARGLEVAKVLDVQGGAVTVSGQAPAAVTVGQPFTATVWLTNATGRAIELDASATVFLISGDLAKGVITSGPVPTGSRVFAPGQSLPYLFTLDALSQGSVPLHGGIYFPNDLIECVATPSVFNVEVAAPSPLDAVLLSSTTLVNVGAAYELALTISNSSTCNAELDSAGDLDAVFPSHEFPYNASAISLLSSDCGSYPCAVPASGSVTIRFTVTPNECGDVDWSGTETGRWSGCGNAPFARVFNSPKIHVRRPAALAEDGSVRWALSKASVVQGQTFEVVATVIPAGENDLAAFTLSPAIHLSSTGTAISVQSVPGVPGTIAGCGACVTNVCPAKAQSFTWSFKADSKGWSGGKVWFTFTATGQDPYSGQTTWSSTTTAQVQILQPSVLSIGGVDDGTGTVHVDSEGSGGVLFGCQVPVRVCFEVDGDTAVSTTTFLPGGGVTPAPAGLVVLSGSPDIPALLTPGEHCFTWTYSPVGAGTVNFTASGVGTEVTYGGTVYVQAATFGGAPLAPAVLTASALVDAPVITTAAGQTVSVIVVARNAGNVPLVNFTATASAQPAGCGAFPPLAPTFVSAASPAVAPLTGCGDTMTFIWTFSATATGAGVVTFSVTLTAQDAQTLAPMSAAFLTTCVTILPRPPLLVTLVAGSSTIVQGADLDVTVRLSNQGATPLNVYPGSQILAANTSDLIPVPPPPPGAAVVPAYTVTDVTARISAKGAAATGPVQITLTPTAFTATDAGVKGAPAVPVTVSGSLIVTVVPPASPVVPGITIGENPWHPLAGPLRLTWGEPDGGPVTLRVLTINGETVRTLLTGTAPGHSGVIVWDGTNETGQNLAAGIYLLRWESAGNKQTRKLAVVK